MKLLFATAFALLVSIVIIGVADAADLPYGYDGRTDYSPYNDPRYGQIYGDPRYRAPPVAERYDRQRRFSEHRQRYVTQPPTRHSYKDGPVFSEPRRYSARPRHYERPGYRCTPRRLIRKRLARQGWCEFSPVRMRPRVAIVDARRDGRSYRLRINRCTGRILRARALNRHHRRNRDFRRFGVTWQPGYRHAY